VIVIGVEVRPETTLVLFKLGWNGLRRNIPLFVLFAGLGALSIFANLTSSSRHEANAPLMGIYMAFTFSFLLADMPRNTKLMEAIKRRPLAALLIIVIICFMGFYTKLGLDRMVWGTRSIGTYALKNGPLKGWYFNQTDGEAVDGLIEFIDHNISKEESLLVLTDLQALYAFTNRDSFRGIPHNYLPGDLPAPGRQLQTVRRHILDNLPDWIVTHHQKTSFVTSLLFYLDIVDEISKSYVPVRFWHNYVIMKKKSP